MKILALDSSGMTASVAVLDERQLIGEYTINHKKTHSQTLLPMLDEVVKMTEMDLHELDAIAVASGPGSFTGLRIGSATVKGLAHALDKPVVEIPTLEAMAYQFFGSSMLICPLMDARRSQVYTGIYRWNNGEFNVVEEQMAVSIEEIIEKVNMHGQKAVYTGDGIDAFGETILQLSDVECFFPPPGMRRQNAASVGARAFDYMRDGKIIPAAQHRPVYLRLSQAERERRERLGNGE